MGTLYHTSVNVFFLLIFNFAPDPLTEGPLRAYQMLILGTNLDVVGVLGPRFHG